MNIYACVKQVPDTEARIVIKGGSAIDEAGIKWIISPYDEFGVEEALKLREKAAGSQVVIVTLGPARAQESIRMALAMGADRALHILCEEPLDHLLTAKALANAITQDGGPGIVFTGRQAIDDDSYQVHIRLARYLVESVATQVTAFELAGEVAKISRETEGGSVEKVELRLPAVIAVTKGINTPRYPTLPNIMKAKSKEIKKLTLKEAGIEQVKNLETIVKMELPAEKPGGRVLKGEKEQTVPELVLLLHDEAKAL